MTKVIRWLKSAVIFCGVLIYTTALAADLPPSPQPFRYVNDYTHTLSAEQLQHLENKLIAYSHETSSQIAVVMVSTTGEYDIADYTFALGDKWGIGRKKANNGVLMLIAKDDRKIFIATGQGLEGVLPDALLSQIIRHGVTPEFKQGRYAEGINNGLNEIIAASKGEYAAYVEESTPYEDYIPVLMVLAFIFIVIIGERQFRKDDVYISPSRHSEIERIMRQSTASRRRNADFGGGFGGGFGGSSGGGFGGGGFGGGGAGGSW